MNSFTVVTSKGTVLIELALLGAAKGVAERNSKEIDSDVLITKDGEVLATYRNGKRL